MSLVGLVAERDGLPPLKDCALELGFYMNCENDDPEGVCLRIYEPDRSTLIAEAFLSRSAVGDLIGNNFCRARIRRFRRRG